MATAAAMQLLDNLAPGLGTVLQLLSDEYAKLKQGRELCESLTLRYTEFADELAKIPPEILHREQPLQRLEALIQDSLATVQVYASERNLLKRVLKFDKFADQIKLYNERLDSLVALLSVSHTEKLAALLQWRAQYELDIASVATQLDQMVNLQTQIREAIQDLPSKQDLLEVALLVQRDKGALDDAQQATPRPPRLVSVLQFSAAQAAKNATFRPYVEKTPPAWLIPADDVQRGELIDDFGTTDVVKASWQGIPVAVKQYGTIGESPVFDRHLEIWRSLVFLHVAQLYGAGSKDGAPFFVYEFAAKQSLDRCWDSFSVTQRYKLLHQAALGLAYLHAMRVVHGNVCCSNLLVTEHNVVKIFGFGASYRRIDSNTNSKKMVSCRAFKAPECLGILPDGVRDGYEHSPSFQSDVYSFGLTIAEALAKRNPLENLSDKEVERMKREDRLLMPNELDDDARALVARMTTRDPSQRVSLAFVVDELSRLAHAP